jgi:hypothetical protein
LHWLFATVNTSRYQIEPNFTEQSSWKANSHSASQEIFSLLWNPKDYYRVHKSLYWAIWMQSISDPISLRFILMQLLRGRLDLQNGVILSGFSKKNLNSRPFLLCVLHASLISCYLFDHPNNIWCRI